MHFKKLTEGESVTLDNGTVITSDQVLEKSLPSEMFIVIFINNEESLNDIVINSQYEPYFAENISENRNLALVYHSCDDISVFQNPKYLEFMQKFGPKVKHVID